MLPLFSLYSIYIFVNIHSFVIECFYWLSWVFPNQLILLMSCQILHRDISWVLYCHTWSCLFPCWKCLIYQLINCLWHLLWKLSHNCSIWTSIRSRDLRKSPFTLLSLFILELGLCLLLWLCFHLNSSSSFFSPLFHFCFLLCLFHINF